MSDPGTSQGCQSFISLQIPGQPYFVCPVTFSVTAFFLPKVTEVPISCWAATFHLPYEKAGFSNGPCCHERAPDTNGMAACGNSW